MLKKAVRVSKIWAKILAKSERLLATKDFRCHNREVSTVAHGPADHDRGRKMATPASRQCAALTLGLFSDQAGACSRPLFPNPARIERSGCCA